MNYTEKAAKIIYFFGYGVTVYLLLKYGLPAVLPFIIAFVASTVAEKAANKLTKKTGTSRRVYCALIIILVISVMLSLSAVIVGRLVYEAKEFAEEYLNDNEKIEILLNGANGLSAKITEKLNISESARQMVATAMDSATEKIAEIVLGKIGSIIEKSASLILTGLPSWLLFITVTTISTFYLGCSKKGNDGISSLLTTEQKKKILKLKSGVAVTVMRYIRAYSLILTVTAAVLLVGFTILKIKYAFIIALLVAVLDLLPVIGIGTVLIPWALIEIANGNHGVGFGLIAVFAVAVVTREIAEAKIIGRCVGTNPLITLSAMYAGLKLFGFAGLLLAPMLLSGIIAYRSEKSKTADIKEGAVPQ